MKKFLFVMLITIITISLESKEEARLFLDMNNVKKNAIKKEHFGTFLEYLLDNVNSNCFGITAQEFDDRGLDLDSTMQIKEKQVWRLHRTCSADSIFDDIIWYCGINKRGLRHYSIIKRAVTGETGYYQRIFLDSAKKYNFYCYFKGNITDSVYLRLTSRKSNKVIYDKGITTVTNDWAKFSMDLPIMDKYEKVDFLLYFKEKGYVDMDEASLLPEDHKFTLRKEFFELMKNLKGGALRFPGGGYADYRTWRWEDCVGDPDQRVAPNFWWDFQIMRMDFSVDEYIAFCKEADIIPYLVVNHLNGTPEEARNLLEYCNGSKNTKYGKMRADNGHPEPYNVKYWEVGNEQWIQFSPNYPHSYLKFYKMMKEYDPSITIFVNGDHWQGPKELERVFSVVKDSAEAFSWHPASVYYPTPGATDEDAYYSMVTWNFQTENDIKFINEGLQKYSSPKVKHCPTEWWSQYVKENHLWLLDTISRASSLEAALSDVNFLHSWLRNHESTIMANRTLFLGFIRNDTNKFGIRKTFGTGGYHAFKMVSAHHGKHFIPLTYEGLKINSKENTPLTKYYDMPILDAVATIDEDSLYISIINRHYTEPVKVTFSVPQTNDRHESTVHTLYSDNVLDFNSADNPEKISIKSKKMMIDSVYTLLPHSLTVLAIPARNIDYNDIRNDKPKDLGIEIMPNPAENIAYISAKGNIISKLNIIDETGKLFLSKSTNDFSNPKFIQLETTFLPNGIYFVEVEINNKKYMEKLVIVR